MKSPFPGLDPFIEGCGLWEDFHDALIQEIKNGLAQAVPDRYLVRTGERAYVVLSTPGGEKAHSFRPDVGLVTSSHSESFSEPGGGTALAETDTEAPLVSMRAFFTDEFRETFVEIREANPDENLVTCIEVLSPSNKRPNSPGWDIYQRKRQDILMGTANLVEIDLLRGGQRLPMIDPWPNSPYTLLVARKLFAPDCRVWQGHFLRPLPTIPVPLIKPDPDVPLNLQPMIEAIYARSKYLRSIDYAKPLTPPLAPAETAWLQPQIKSRE